MVQGQDGYAAAVVHHFPAGGMAVGQPHLIHVNGYNVSLEFIVAADKFLIQTIIHIPHAFHGSQRAARVPSAPAHFLIVHGLLSIVNFHYYSTLFPK